MLVPVRRALLSVSDKSGIVEFAAALAQLGVDIISTGGTARLLQERGIPVREVASVTGFPEMMDGRVKTLHPMIHGGLLGRRGVDDAVMSSHGIQPIDLLAVNLYPFAQTVACPDCTYADAVENIDIGGPAMVRAAAKNHESVVVAVDPSDYNVLLEQLRLFRVRDEHAFGDVTRVDRHGSRVTRCVSVPRVERCDERARELKVRAFERFVDLGQIASQLALLAIQGV